jgi:hypothetical protein
MKTMTKEEEGLNAKEQNRKAFHRDPNINSLNKIQI